MYRIITAAAIAAALMVAPQAFAADDASTPKPATEAMGATGGQPAGTETSDRTPSEKTRTPWAQVDQTKDGETSDRTPKN
jgi:hypothetical protein